MDAIADPVVRTTVRAGLSFGFTLVAAGSCLVAVIDSITRPWRRSGRGES